MKHANRFRLLLFVLLGSALPAYANNPPQPDGLLSILLIFPLAILGRELAGVAAAPKPLWRRAVLVLVLTVSAILCAGGTALALLPVLIILAYGIWRGVQILRGGRGGKRVAIGLALIAWALVAVLDYVVSIKNNPSTLALESVAVSRLRSLAKAEDDFKNPTNAKTVDSQAYATIAELQNAHIVSWSFPKDGVERGYLYGEIVDKTQNQFLFYAVPAFPYRSKSDWLRLVPGGSLRWALIGNNRSRDTGQRSFAVDETGVIRVALRRPAGTPVTREEALGWEILH